jgi:predicted secreted protein
MAAVAPTVTVTPSQLTLTALQALIVTIAVTGGAGTPTGSVKLSYGTAFAETLVLQNGIAQFTIPAGQLPTGADLLTGAYTPDANSTAAYTAASGTSTVTVSATPYATRLNGDLAQCSVGLAGAQSQVLGLQEWNIDRKFKTTECTTTDDQGDEANLTSTRSWTASAKFAYIDGDPSQAANIINAITVGQQPVQWNFFPAAVSGRGAWSGLAWVDSYKLSGGVGKLFAFDVTLKGSGKLSFNPQLAPIAGVAQAPNA